MCPRREGADRPRSRALPDREPRPGRATLAAALLVPVLLLVGGIATVPGFGAPARPGGSTGLALVAGVPDARAAGSSPDTATPNASVSVGVAPATVCPTTWPTCPAGTGAARVSLTTSYGSGTGNAVTGNVSGRVQVLFLLETTPYDGAYDASAADPGRDACGQSNGKPLCEESSLDPTFASYSGTVVSALAAAHPTDELTFGLVDYFATLTSFDDGDGFPFHVDVGNFTTASSFPNAVNATLLNASSGVLDRPSMTLPDSDLSDNFLASSEITALYGALEGAGLNWSANAQHVLVLLGSTAPRDPGYPVDYCGSPATYYYSTNCSGSTCEPIYTFTTGASPNCEGWVSSQDGNASHSIAALAAASSDCTHSALGRCVIDALDVWDTPTDPHSKGWPSTTNASIPANDSASILKAGCDLALATGGSWDGPTFASCNGTAGSMTYRNYSSSVADPGLVSAIANVSLGPPGAAMVTPGPAPFLSLLLGPDVALAAAPAYSAVCSAAPGAPNASCEQTPSVSNRSGVVGVGWNWSAVPSENVLLPGDSWTVSFDVVPAPGATGNLTLLRCAAAACVAAGAGPVDGAASDLAGSLLANGELILADVPYATVVAMPLPVLGLRLTPSSATGEAPFTATFEVSVTGGADPSPVQVSFGDGGQAYGSGTLFHTYAGPGTYDVVASVTDSLGRSVDQRGQVVVLPSLSAGISTGETAGEAPFAPQLAASVFGGEAPYTYDWSWAGGASTAATATPTLGVGTWNVSLEVHDALGYDANATLTLTVLAAPANGTGSPPGGGTHATPPAGGGAATSSLLPSGLWLGVGALAAIGVLLAVVAAVRRGRRRGPRRTRR